ncbi:hypothetical protein [Paraburkholderia ultramafica]|nr:hypothetical protein [Paraburkholderia ultramafica]
MRLLADVARRVLVLRFRVLIGFVRQRRGGILQRTRLLAHLRIGLLVAV